MGRPRPLGAASVVGHAATGAARWMSITLRDPEGGGTALVVEADEVTLLLAPRPPGVFDVLPVEPGTAAVDWVVPTVTRFLEGDGPRGVGVVCAGVDHEVTFAAGTEDGTSYWLDHGDGEHRELGRSGVLHILRLSITRLREGQA